MRQLRFQISERARRLACRAWHERHSPKSAFSAKNADSGLAYALGLRQME
jgi:hypothetical protein